MKMNKRVKRVYDIMLVVVFELFPNVRAYVDFFLLWLFLVVMMSNVQREPLIVLVSALGVIYCFNEWAKISRRRQENGS